MILTQEQQAEYDDLLKQAEIFFNQRHWPDALLVCKKILLLHPTSIDTLIRIGQIYQNVGQFRKAILSFRRVVELQGEDTPLFVRVSLLEMEKKYVSWDTLQQSFDFFKDEEVLSYGELPPFLALSNPLTNRQLQLVAKSCCKREKFLSPKLSFFDFSDRKKNQEKLRLGFMCGDFRSHPTGYLLGEFFELIDRNRFDVYIYDTHPEINDPIHKRIYATTPNATSVDQLNDQAAAQRIFEDKIDVLIDLSGHTTFHRLGILTYQPAVAQATYSGFPGTCGGIPGLGYILADEYVIPPDQQKFFSEKVKYLKPSYRVMDRNQSLPMAPLMRKHLNFDPDTIVLCCFNNSYKYTPNYFDLWARILKQVPKAILWFYRQENFTEINIMKEFEKRDVADRIVFADFMPHTEHLARYQVADLFLDTENYNAHTTGAEALFMGCPMITCPGNTFASRVGGTMLKALELDELICKDIQEYEEKVVKLCNTPNALKKLREKTLEKVQNAPLFDMEKFTRSFEQNCREMFEESLDSNISYPDLSKETVKKNRVESFEKKNNSEAIPIFFNVNDSYVEHLAVTMVSILQNTNRKCHFYVLNSDVSENSKNYLEQLKDKYTFDIEYINVDKTKFDSFPNYVVPHISKDGHYRLLIPDFAPSLEKVIYLDVDLVLDGDIEKLWEIDIGDNYIGAVPDQVGRRSDPSNYVLKLGLPKDSMYINSGVLIMNLKKLRQDKMVEKFFEVAEQYKEQLHFGDQDILAIACASKIYYLKHYFNATPTLHYEFWNEKKEAFSNPIIIHWAGGPKPWTNFNVPMKEYYYKYSRLLKNDK